MALPGTRREVAGAVTPEFDIEVGDLADSGARWLADAIHDAQRSRGVCHLAVSGGSTPLAAFRALGELEVEWRDVHVWQVDERVAPDGDPARNAGGLIDSLIGRVGIPASRIHLMDVTATDLAVAAASYGDELAASCRGVLDVVHLGLGTDGHTASWPPGDPVTTIVDRDVALSGEYGGYVRMTLTVPCVNRARSRLILVGVADKARALASLRSGSGDIPASNVAATGTTLMTTPVTSNAIPTPPVSKASRRTIP